MNLKLKIPFFNKNKNTDSANDGKELHNFYLETGHSGFSEESLREPIVSQQTREMIKYLDKPTKFIGVDGTTRYERHLDVYGVPNRPFYDEPSEILNTEELLKISNDWITNNIDKLNRDTKDLSFPSFKESLDLERDNEIKKDERLRNVYLKKRLARESRKEKKNALFLEKRERKAELERIRIEEENNPNKKYVDLALEIINRAEIIIKSNHNRLQYSINYTSHEKTFNLNFKPKYEEFQTHIIYDAEIKITETNTQHYDDNLIYYYLTDNQSELLTKRIAKRTKRIKKKTLYDMFDTFGMNEEK